MSDKPCSIPGDLISIADAIIRLSKIPKESVSAIFDFEKETITFECHYCNGIISGLDTDFTGESL